ncbi:BQ5605_C023g09722 [Microbotryum silenes-dioicae]|uniref:BQ5605_C023g09722 protein n=1 Tax=Microbotryum silenes-dioicae TaxID=796604 RepID=A0A2X0MP21_9BASI|nr:BQ5605_C023g09722 [Microbotryum silenes-dioicae]
MTVVVYGLDQASEYEIGLEVVKASTSSSRSTTATGTGTGTEGTTELQDHHHHHHHHQRGVIQVETPLSNPTLRREHDEAHTGHPSPHRVTTSTDYSADPALTSTSSPTTPNANESNHTSSHSSTPDGPPPPYSPSPSPLANDSSTSPSTSTTNYAHPSSTVSEPPTDEPHLRAQLKNIRASSKRTESVLQASINALKKSVDKALKEDQRARTRIVGLEDAIRKATEGEKFMRLEERGDVEGALERLVREEEERGSELKRRKEGAGNIGKEEGVGMGNRKGEEEGNGGGNVAPSGEVGVGELMKELDALNVKIEEKDKDERKKLQDAVKHLEAELTRLDNEFIQCVIPILDKTGLEKILC